MFFQDQPFSYTECLIAKVGLIPNNYICTKFYSATINRPSSLLPFLTRGNNIVSHYQNNIWTIISILL